MLLLVMNFFFQSCCRKKILSLSRFPPLNCTGDVISAFAYWKKRMRRVGASAWCWDQGSWAGYLGCSWCWRMILLLMLIMYLNSSAASMVTSSSFPIEYTQNQASSIWAKQKRSSILRGGTRNIAQGWPNMIIIHWRGPTMVIFSKNRL